METDTRIAFDGPDLDGKCCADRRILRHSSLCEKKEQQRNTSPHLCLRDKDWRLATRSYDVRRRWRRRWPEMMLYRCTSAPITISAHHANAGEDAGQDDHEKDRNDTHKSANLERDVSGPLT